MIRSFWEERADTHQDRLAGVLFEKLPEHANLLIHHWHTWLLREKLLPFLGANSRVVDVGSGYGRLSAEIIRLDPSVEIVGLDFVSDYAARYVDRTGRPAVVGDLMHLPMRLNCVDAVICVTALMYLGKADLSEALEGIMGILDVGGVTLIVEPGPKFTSASRRFRGAVASPTSGRGIAIGELHAMIRELGGAVIGSGANRAFGVLSPIIRFPRAQRLSRTLSRLVARFDESEGTFGADWAPHHWTVFRRIS